MGYFDLFKCVSFWGTSYSRPPIDPYLTSPPLQNPGGATNRWCISLASRYVVAHRRWRRSVLRQSVGDVASSRSVHLQSRSLSVQHVADAALVLTLQFLPPTHTHTHTRWRRGVVVSGVRRMNEVNPARRARLVLGWVTRVRAGIPSRYVTRQPGQLSLASLRGRLIEYQLRLG